MGYSTDFSGSVEIEPPLNEHEIAYLRDFAKTRRMNRTGGPYFVKGEGAFGQGAGPDEVLNYNDPPEGQPGLWCQWAVADDGSYIEWDHGEKFYNSAEWMAYLIDHFLRPGAKASMDLVAPVATEEAVAADERFTNFTFDHTLNGEIEAQGEDPSDRWLLIVENNKVKVANGTFTYDRDNADEYN